jgi:hypothetical protein
MQSNKLGRAACALVLLAAWVAAACGDSKTSAAGGTAGQAAGESAGGTAGEPSMDLPSVGGSDAAGAGAAPADAGAGPMTGGAGCAGAGGEPPVTGSGKLGAECATTADCGAGLSCVAPTDLVLADGAPPHGLCTAPCTASEACDALSTGALCVPYGETEDGYCMQGCTFGDPPLGQTKCQGRTDQACLPAFLVNTNDPCAGPEDCFSGEICNGTCQAVLAACIPTCTGDFDCEDGLYCNQQFLNGTCVPDQPTGKPLGAPCAVPGPNDPAEPDECVGFCQADSAESDQGHCSASCGLTSPCGWDAATEKFGGVCLYASSLTAETGGVGDFGFCTPSCNCAADCDTDGVACEDLGLGPLGPDFVGQGLCFAPSAQSTPLEACE